MKKIVLIDIGTHYGQEILSLFRPYYVASKIIKLLINYFLRNKKRLPNPFRLRDIKKVLPAIFSSYKISKIRNTFILIGIEPNTLLFSSPAYKLLDIVLPIAIGNSDFETLSLKKFFFGYSNPKFKGNSIFESKENLNPNNFMRVMCTNPDYIFKEISKMDELENYKIIIRLNCEGSEDDIIYSAYENFGDRLIGLMGDLSDVSKTKGALEAEKLNKFIEINKIPFTNFSSSPLSWYQGHKYLLDILKK